MENPASGAPRALTARSVLLSVLLGTDPPRLPVSLLVSTTELFGITEGTTRTALSRMVAKDELRSASGWYELSSARLLHRQVRQTVSRTGSTIPWSRADGWMQAVIVAEGRRPAADRAELRRALAEARFAELRYGVWVRPANLEVSRPLIDDEPLVWGRSDFEADPTSLVAELWDLDTWSRRAKELIRSVRALTPDLDGDDRSALAPGFVLSATVLRHLGADPLLPRPLLPTGWPGSELRQVYDRFDAAYRRVLGTWFDEHRDRRDRSS